LLALQFLAAEHITPAVYEMHKLTTHTQLIQLLDYVEATWLSSSVWDVDAWSIFGRAIRTNNDVEGWHHRMNSRSSHCKLHFYSLLKFLHEEAKLVLLYACLVSEGKLTRLQRTLQQRLHKKILYRVAFWKYMYNIGLLPNSQKNTSRIVYSKYCRFTAGLKIKATQA